MSNVISFTDKLREIINRKQCAIIHETGKEPKLHVYLGRKQKVAFYEGLSHVSMVQDPRCLGQPTMIDGCTVHWVMEDDHLNIVEMTEV